MSQLKNCPECGRIFVDLGTGICRDCMEKQEELMIEVSSYVRDHPHSTIRDIMDAVGVKEKLIRRMIREGRFIADGVDVSYPCERCGKPIHNGRYCSECTASLQQEVYETQKRAAEKAERAKRPMGVGMHSKDLGKKKN